jgi:hypothetical protein
MNRWPQRNGDHGRVTSAGPSPALYWKPDFPGGPLGDFSPCTPLAGHSTLWTPEGSDEREAFYSAARLVI